jgi:hypothetical protein
LLDLSDQPAEGCGAINAVFDQHIAHLDERIRELLHLLESLTIDQSITEFIGKRHAEVEKISWSRDTVWVDKAQTTGFRGVRDAVWNFHIGGYQICMKWLKDRKGRTLTTHDITHYQKIVVAVSETIRLMMEIDAVIEQHGGWPGAFKSTTE